MNRITTDEFEWTAERLMQARVVALGKIAKRINAPDVEVLPANTIIEVNGRPVRLTQPVLVESA